MEKVLITTQEKFTLMERYKRSCSLVGEQVNTEESKEFLYWLCDAMEDTLIM